MASAASENSGKAASPKASALVPWLTYVTYASLYFSWKNMAIAKRAMVGGASLAQEPTGSGGGLTTEAVNGAETAFLVSYMVAQFCVGWVDRGHHLTLPTLFTGCAVTTMLCSVATDGLQLAALWGINGFCQGCVYPLMMSLLNSSLTPANRGAVMGLWSTNGTTGAVVATAVVGYVLQEGGWRAAFVWPAALTLASAVALAAFMPHGNPTAGSASIPKSSPASTLVANSKATGTLASLRLPFVWQVGASLGLVKLARYTFMLWIPTYLQDTLGMEVAQAAYVSTVFDVGAGIGGPLCGFLADWALGGRRLAVSACMTLLGAVGVWGLASLPPHPALSHVLCLLLAIGCLLAGNNTVMGGAGIVDVVELGSAGDAGVSRARLPGASGVVNGVGSLGAVLQGPLTTALLGASAASGWTRVFVVNGAACALAALVVLPAVTASERARVRAQPASPVDPVKKQA